MGLLSFPEVLDIAEAAADLGLLGQRRFLLADVPRAFRDELPLESAPSAQIRSDLLHLNEAGQLDDGSVPLRSWLEIAIRLSSSRVTTRLEDKLAAVEAALAAPRPAPQAPPVAASSPGRAAAPTPAALRQLRGFLLSAFSGPELVQLVRYDLPAIRYDINERGPLAQVVDDLIAAAERNSLLDRALFDALARERPRREAEIRGIQAAFGL